MFLAGGGSSDPPLDPQLSSVVQGAWKLLHVPSTLINRLDGFHICRLPLISGQSVTVIILFQIQ